MSELRAIASVMGGEVSGGYARFPTPGHSPRDRGSRASIVPGAPDGVLVQCENGDPIAVKAEMRARGLLPERATFTRSRDVASWNYTDADGALCYRKVRSEPKSFRFEHPDGKGSWKNGRGGDSLPYRLPDLANAAPGAEIYMAEGEKQADKLAAMGHVATSLKDWKPDFGRYVEGRRVFILPDNDDTGRAQAQAAFDKVRAAGGNPYFVTLPDLPPGGDICDSAITPEELWALVERALNERADQVEADLVAEPRLKITATPYVWRDPATIPPRPWALGRWLLLATVTAVIAPGGVGKTTFISSLAWSMITGRALLGKKVWRGKTRVWIWNLEDDGDELSRSIQAAAKHYGLTKNDLADYLSVDSAMEGQGLCTATEEPTFRLLSPVFDAIVAEIIARQIGILIIDPFVSSHEVDENANSKIDKIAKAWGRVAKAANCSIVLVHHASKAGSHDVTALSSRGASSLINACRSALVFNRMDDDVATRFGVEEAERRRYFSVVDDKHNRAPAELADWFRLASVDLGNGDSMGVAEPWAPPGTFDGMPADCLRKVQAAIHAGEYRKDWQSPAWAGQAVADVLGLSVEDKRDRSRINGMLKTWLANGALKVVQRNDHKSTPRSWIIVGRWQDDTSSPPRKGGVRKGEDVRSQSNPHHHPHVMGWCGGEDGKAEKVVGNIDDDDPDDPARTLLGPT